MGTIMAKNKTVATESSVEAYFDAIEDTARREDCKALAELISKATKERPKMWGSSIVGFGSYHYVYDSGREGDSCLVGFSSRKNDISLYLSSEVPDREDLLAKLGKHKEGKGCIQIRSLADVDRKVLEKLVTGTVAERKRRHS